MDEVLNKVVAVVIAGVTISFVMHLIGIIANAKMSGYRLRNVEKESSETKKVMYEHAKENTDEHRDFDRRILVVETKGENP